jgi:serine/threonine-protein kinase
VTATGVIVGTAAYMSPEQAAGKPVDHRTDIWAFGCVLFEMLTGRAAFGGDTWTDTLAAVMRAEPEWSRLTSGVTVPLRELIRRCLRKDPRQRLQAIGDARIALEDILAGGVLPAVAPGEPEPARTRTSQRWSLPWGWAALLLLAVAALSSLIAYRVGTRRAVPAAPAVLRTKVDLPPDVTLSGLTLALSPDGSKLVTVGEREGKTQLYLRSVDQEETRPIEGTAGARGPFFSPDGQWIGFWADGRLQKLPLTGGKPTIICPAIAENGAAWLPDDTIVFSSGFGLQRVSVQEGHPEVIATRDASKGEYVYESPVALPGGNALLFSIRSNTLERRVAVLTLNDRHWRTLVPGAEQPRFIAPGFVVVNRGGTLEVAAFDTARLTVSGPFTRLGAGASIGGLHSPTGGDVVSYDVAAAGRSLVYVKSHSAEESRGVYSLDLHGKAELLSTDPRLYADPAVSSDGTKIAVDVASEPGVNEIWVLTDLVRRTWRRLTTGQNDWQPAWRDHDHTLIFVRGRGDNATAIWDVYAVSATRNGTPTLLASFPHSINSYAVAPDGSAVVFAMLGPSSVDLWTQPLGRDDKAPDRPAAPLVATPYNENAATCGFSPDGRWLAYTSDTIGRSEIYVTDFPAGSTTYPVTSAGGARPCWSKDGRQIFYWKGNTVMAVAARAGETFAADTPHKVVDSSVTPRWGYDVAKDGTFYVAGYEGDRASPIVFVSDISGELPLGTADR